MDHICQADAVLIASLPIVSLVLSGETLSIRGKGEQEHALFVDPKRNFIRKTVKKPIVPQSKIIYGGKIPT